MPARASRRRRKEDRFAMPSIAVPNQAIAARFAAGRRETAVATTPRSAVDLRWDPLLISIAVYMLMAVGRLHQLFPFVGLVRPAILAGATAMVLYIADSR